MLWRLQEIEALCGQPQPDPGQILGLALATSRFLEHSPCDFLEPLLTSPFGRVYSLLLERGCGQELPDPEGVLSQQRDQLSQRLRLCGFQGPEAYGLLLALMPLYPPGKLRVEDAPSKLPSWLLELYRRRYEPPSVQGMEPESLAPSGKPGFNDRIFLNRMLGLSNLYYIDPDDQEIRQELRQVRLQTVALLLSTTREELGRHFSSDFGDRFWAMAQSGMQKEPLDSNEVAQRDAIQTWLSATPNSLHQEGGIQRFAAALLFSVPGSVALADPERNLPAWFVEGYRRYTSMAAAA